MKKFIMILLLGIAVGRPIPTVAQGDFPSVRVETPTYGEGQTPLLYEAAVPGASTPSHSRHINGSTVFIVTYDNNVDIRLQAAFDYACRLWEECLPTVPPIKIKVSMAPLPTSPKPVLSQVNMQTYAVAGNDMIARDELLSPLSAIKAVCFRDYERHLLYQYTNLQSNMSILNEYDFEVVYNSDYESKFSYSIGNKSISANTTYDLTTIALRDIGKGLGFMCGFEADNQTKTMLPLTRWYLPFEDIILRRYAYQYSQLVGTTCVLEPIGVIHTTRSTAELTLTKTQTWETGSSLSGFKGKSGVGLTSAMNEIISFFSFTRHISDENFPDYFNAYLSWYPDVALSGSSHKNIKGHTDYSLPTTTSISTFMRTIPTTLKTVIPYRATSSSSTSETESSPLDNWFQRFSVDHLKSQIPKSDNIGVFLLKPDGCWQKVSNTVQWNANSVLQNYGNNFARDCDGKLRAMIIYRDTASLCTANARPQPVEIACIRRSVSQSTVRCTFGFKKAEGVNSMRVVIVTRDVMGNTISTEEVSITDMEYRIFSKALSANRIVTLTPYASNDAGESQGKPLTLNLQVSQSIVPSLTIQNNAINFQVEDSDGMTSYPYIINRYSDYSTEAMAEGEYSDNTVVDISSFSPGNYVLNYNVGNDEWKSLKFQKK